MFPREVASQALPGIPKSGARRQTCRSATVEEASIASPEESTIRAQRRTTAGVTAAALEEDGLMSLSLDLAAAIQPLVGQTFLPPHRISVSDSRGNELTVVLISVESLGLAVEELRLKIDSLSAASLDILKTWAAGLCQRITYLLETLHPLEYDAQGQEVLIRSNPPDTSLGHPRYYEVILSAHGQGQFSLRRFDNPPGQGGRVAVPLRMTHEQLSKLVNDLMATLPTP